MGTAASACLVPKWNISPCAPIFSWLFIMMRTPVCWWAQALPLLFLVYNSQSNCGVYLKASIVRLGGAVQSPLGRGGLSEPQVMIPGELGCWVGRKWPSSFFMLQQTFLNLGTLAHRRSDVSFVSERNKSPLGSCLYISKLSFTWLRHLVRLLPWGLGHCQWLLSSVQWE